MIRSQIIEASSFTQSRADFNIPQKLASSIKIAHLGVYGGVGYVQNAITGMANVISKIVLRDGATVLSQYDQNINNYLEFKLLKQNNSRHRNINKVLYSSNFGMLSNNGGVNSAAQVAGVANGEALVNPRVCVDKHDLKRSALAEADSDLAVVSLADMLGFCGATFSDGEEQIANVIPCHIFSNLKLSIEFKAPAQVAANATTVAQPYLIFDELVNPALEQQLAKPSVMAQYVDLELEKVFLGAGTASKAYLNGFYGKTLGNLYMMCSDESLTYALSQYQPAEVLRLNVNNTPLFQLTSGIDTPAKKAAFLRMLGIDLSIPLMSDRVLDGVPLPAADADATSLYEGAAAAANVQTQFYSGGVCSYSALPINTRINQLQLDYSRQVANNASALLFWGEVMKVMTTGSDGNKVVSYM
jgi:hypothetical protein